MKTLCSKVASVLTSPAFAWAMAFIVGGSVLVLLVGTLLASGIRESRAWSRLQSATKKQKLADARKGIIDIGLDQIPGADDIYTRDNGETRLRPLSGCISAIQPVVVNGQTYYYFRVRGNASQIFGCPLKGSAGLALAKPGEIAVFKYTAQSSPVIRVSAVRITDAPYQWWS